MTGVDVYAPNDGLVVGLGDSITVGANASDEGWPYWLADRLTQVAAQGGPRLSIIDMGISGNQVTRDNAIAGILLSPLTPAGDLTEPFPYGSVSTPRVGFRSVTT